MFHGFIMETRRRLLVFGLLATLIGLGVGGCVLCPGTAITRENAAKIEQGMTVQEVEAILGDCSRSEVIGTIDRGECLDMRWSGPECSIAVVFVGGKVEYSCLFGPDETVVTRVRRWLRL